MEKLLEYRINGRGIFGGTGSGVEDDPPPFLFSDPGQADEPPLLSVLETHKATIHHLLTHKTQKPLIWSGFVIRAVKTVNS